MPQMGPLSWTLLFIFVSLLFILFLTFLYSVTFSEINFLSSKSRSITSLIWQW